MAERKTREIDREDYDAMKELVSCDEVVVTDYFAVCFTVLDGDGGFDVLRELACGSRSEGPLMRMVTQ